MKVSLIAKHIVL